MEPGRLANVAGAMLVDEPNQEIHSHVRAMAEILDACFEEILVLGYAEPAGSACRIVSRPEGAPSRLADLAALLAASTTERLLVVRPGGDRFEPDLALALCAWPERDAVRVASEEDAEGDARCAIYRREPVLAAARAALASGARMLSALDARVDVERASLAMLGLADLECDGSESG